MNSVSEFETITVERLRRRSGEKWSHYPSDVLPAWVADMDFEIAAPIRAAVEARLAAGDCGYPMSPSSSGLPEIFCERTARRHGWRIEAQSVDLFNDVVQAIYFGLLALADENEGVVIQTPIYPPFISSTETTGRRAVLSPLIGGRDRYEIDFDHLESVIDDTTRILLFCNPHNPTGRCFTQSELERIADLVLRHQLWIISDEIHADLVYEPHRHIPIASLAPEVAERTVTLMSASKAFNIAGICMAFAAFGGDTIRKAFDRVPHHLRGATSALSYAAVSAAFTAGDDWLNHVMRYLMGNRDYLAQHARENWSTVRHHAPEATYLSWFDCRAMDLQPSPYRYLLDNARVAVSEGARFGDPGRGFVRINFATSRAILQDIVSRIDGALVAR